MPRVLVPWSAQVELPARLFALVFPLSRHPQFHSAVLAPRLCRHQGVSVHCCPTLGLASGLPEVVPSSFFCRCSLRLVLHWAWRPLRRCRAPPCSPSQVKKRGKTLTSASNVKSIFYKKKWPQWKSSTSDIAQAQAKLYLPPGTSIWRSNYRGSSAPWLFVSLPGCVHLPELHDPQSSTSDWPFASLHAEQGRHSALFRAGSALAGYAGCLCIVCGNCLCALMCSPFFISGGTGTCHRTGAAAFPGPSIAGTARRHALKRCVTRGGATLRPTR